MSTEWTPGRGFVFIVAAALVLAGCAHAGQERDSTGAIGTEEILRLLWSGEDFVVYYRYTSCIPCEQLDTQLTPVARLAPRLYTLDLSRNPEAGYAFSIRVVPTVVRYARGREIMRVEGLQDMDAYWTLLTSER